MDDKQNRKVEALADAVQQTRHPLLYRDVQSRDTSSAISNSGSMAGAPDANGLALAAGQLVRIAVGGVRIELYQLHQLAGAGMGGGPRLTIIDQPLMIESPTVGRGLSDP